MSDFYGQLAKEALGDDVSDVSEGELQEMLANMDDLDAGLFGSANIPKSSIKLPEEEPVSLKVNTRPAQVEKPSPVVIPKSKKSELLAELFGSDGEESTMEPAEEPKPKSKPEIKFKFNEPASPIKPKIPQFSLDKEAEESKSSLTNYVPTARERRRRNAGKNKPVEDLWSEFLQPEKSLETVEKEEISALREDKPDLPVKKGAEIEDRPLVGRRAPEVNPPTRIAAPVKFELTDEMKEQILTMIKEEQQKSSSEICSKLGEEIGDLRRENLSLKDEVLALEELVSTQRDSIENLQKTVESSKISFLEQLEDCNDKLRYSLQEQHLQYKDKMSEVQCQLSQLEERVEDLQQLADSLQPVQISLKAKISNLQADFKQSQEQLSNFVSQVRDVGLEEDKRLRKHFEEKIFKIASQIGDWEILERKLGVFEERMKKIASFVSDNRNEEEIVRRLERSENGILQKLNYCNGQQVRQENWHQQQLSDISEHVDQRLWGLHRHVDMAVSSLKGEMGTLRADMSNRLGEMENKVICAENETSRLSRLAERLCGLLQLWEMRNKESAKIQQVAEQSLRERFSLVMAERQFEGK